MGERDIKRFTEKKRNRATERGVNIHSCLISVFRVYRKQDNGYRSIYSIISSHYISLRLLLSEGRPDYLALCGVGRMIRRKIRRTIGNSEIKGSRPRIIKANRERPQRECYQTTHDCDRFPAPPPDHTTVS